MTATTPARRPGGPLRPADLRDVRIDHAFWAPRRETVRTTTLPQQERQLRTVGQLEALRLQWREGDPREPHVFWARSP
ncbi:hypothetical protein [Cellulomonas sp.]|uniref:hypothetical protein n=1 Tax=Cellulomonas sp. TaxID=40001 RepID=UPI002810AD3F|nr:hypothetical protein [Cellulomonas sp.]